MSTFYLYTIYDRVAEESGPIFEALNDGVAARQYRRLVLNEHVLPSEYSLICVGTWDRSTMLVKALPSVREVNVGDFGGKDEKSQK